MKLNSILIADCIIFALHCQIGQGSPLRLEEFYSQSFRPKTLTITYEIRDKIGIFYNISALEPLPGKILFNLFLRRIVSVPAATTPYPAASPRKSKGITIERSTLKSENVVHYKNTDFCNTLDIARNFTIDHNLIESLLQPTFITSCPLTRGYFYVTNATIQDTMLCTYLSNGMYWVHFELIQVFEEVTTVMNFKAKFFIGSPPIAEQR